MKMRFFEVVDSEGGVWYAGRVSVMGLLVKEISLWIML
jgi:hypothetical protein